jgi:hypothetical protein
LRTVANGCEQKRDVQRTHSQPPDPQSETGTLATHSGKEELEKEEEEEKEKEEEELRLSCYAGLQLNACKNCDKGGF